MLCGGCFEEWVVIYLVEMSVSVYVYGLGFCLQELEDKKKGGGRGKTVSEGRLCIEQQVQITWHGTRPFVIALVCLSQPYFPF